jgi:hypothetical protein
MSQKRARILINLAFLPAFLLIFLFAGIQHCFWFHHGWCHDVAPLIVGVESIIAATLCYALILGARRIWMTSTPSWKLFLPVLLAVAVIGTFFNESERRRKAVWNAVYNKDMESLRSGIGIWTGPNTTGLMNSQSILDFSIQQGFTEGAKFLLEKGADPNGMVGPCDTYHPHTSTHAFNNEEIHKILKPLSPPLCPALKAIWMRNGNCEKIGCD